MTNPDLRDSGHMCVLDSMNFAHFNPILYISVVRVVLSLLGHFGTAQSLMDPSGNAEMPASD